MHADALDGLPGASLRAMLDTLPDLVWLKDPDGVYLYCNRAFERLYATSLDVLRGKTDDAFVEPALADFFREHDRKAMRANAPSVNQEWLTFAEDGRRGLFETIKTPMRDASGAVIGVLGIARDITALHETQEALRQREAKYSAIVHLAAHAIVLVDIETARFVEFNDAACGNLGYSRDEFAAMTVADIEAAHGPEDIRANLDRMLASGEHRFETRHRHRDGHVLDVSVSARAIRLDGRDYVETLWVDITPIKQVERALLRREAMLARTEQLANVGSWEWNPRTGVVVWSAEMFRISGLDPAQGAPDLDAHAALFHPDDFALLARSLEAAARQAIPYRIDLRLVRPDGGMRHCIGHGIPELDESGQVSLVAGFMQDVTEQRKAESLYRESEATLARAQAVARIGSWKLDVRENRLEWSEETYRIFGVEPGRALSYELFLSFIHPDDASAVDAAWRAALLGAPYDIRHRVVVDGRVKWVHELAELTVDADGRLVAGLGTVQDVTRQWRDHLLLVTGNQTLRALARGASLGETLATIASGVESVNPDMLCSILLLDEDGVRLRHGAAPRLPEAYMRAIDGTAIGPKAGSCGTAAYRGEPVHVRDIEHDPLWQDYAHLALEHGLRACWSTPIMSSRGAVLGTFAVYYTQPADAPEEDVELIRHVTALASQVIERAQAETALKISEARLGFALQGANDGLWDWNLDTGEVYYSPRWLSMLGYAEGELGGTLATWSALVDPAQREETIRLASDYIEGRVERFEIEFRMRHKDGYWVDVLSRARLARDAQGRLLEPRRLVGTHVDISALKRAERDLRESETLLRTVIDESPDIVCMKDERGKFLMGNRELARLYNTTTEGLVGKDDADFIDNRAHADFMRQNVLEIMRSGEAQVVMEDSTDAVTGETRHFVSIKKPLRCPDGTSRILIIAHDVTDLIRAREHAEASQRRLDYAMGVIGEGVWDWDIVSGQVTHNAQWCRLLGLSDDFLTHPVERFFELVHPEDRARVEQAIRQALDDRGDYESRYRLCRQDDGVIWAEDRGRVVERDGAGRPRRMVGSVKDITQSKRSEESLRLAAQVFGGSHSSILITDRDANLVLVNPAFSRVTGYADEEVLGKNPRILQSGRHDQAFFRDLWRDLQEKGFWQGELWNRRKDGSEYVEWLSITGVRDENGQISHYIGISDDITATKAAQSRIEFLAYHDVLTELPNRQLARDRAEQSIMQAQRSQSGVAVLFVDLDQFKAVNDALGHAAGDELLREAARRLRSSVRESDTVSRQGGDEFIIILPGAGGAEEVSEIAGKLLEMMSAPFDLAGQRVSVSASIGVALYPEDGPDFDTLLKKADMAMYSAKSAGRNAYRFFTEEMNTYVMDHILMRNGLLRALEHEEFIVHYQPQLDIASGRMTGAEALIRWRHPELGVIMPDRFIGVAEESGLIVEIGRWVMREACRQVRQWQSLSGVGDLRVAVNISALQLRRGDLEQTVHDALEASGLPPSCLELELTESVLLKDYAQSLVVMERLRRLGVKMSIDDFGTGYSSLAYLKQLPVDRLKIDRTFVRDVLGDPDDAAITQAVISLGHILGLDVLAEGVETEAQLAFLREHGCDEFQGYVFSRPLSAEAFERLLTERITMRPH